MTKLQQMSFNRWSYIFKSTVDMKYQEISGRHLRPPFFSQKSSPKPPSMDGLNSPIFSINSFFHLRISLRGNQKQKTVGWFLFGGEFAKEFENFHGNLNFGKVLEVYYGSQLGYDVSLGTPWAESVCEIYGSVSTGKSLVVHIHQLEIGWIQRWWDLFSQHVSTFQSASFPEVPQGCGVEKNLRCSCRTSG